MGLWLQPVLILVVKLNISYKPRISGQSWISKNSIKRKTGKSDEVVSMLN